MSKTKIPGWVKKLGIRPAKGGHEPQEVKANRQACIMELVNVLSPQYEIWGTDAHCVDNGLTEWSIELNDSITDDDLREKTLKFAPRYLGTDFKKNHKQMRLGAYEWAKDCVTRHNLKDEDAYYYDRDDSKPYKVKKSYYSNWERAFNNANGVWFAFDEQVLTPIKNRNEQEKARIKEAVKFLDAILPEGTEVKPDWDRLRNYFEKGELPDLIENEIIPVTANIY